MTLRSADRPGRRRRSWIAWLAGVVLVTGAIGIGFLISASLGDDVAPPVTTSIGATTSVPLRSEAGEAAGRYLSAWSAFDWQAMASMTSAPIPAFTVTHQVWAEDLDVAAATFVIDRERTTAKGVTVELTASIEITEAGTWSFPTALDLVEDAGAWVVDWTPAVLHPSLEPGDRLVLDRVLPSRASITAFDGTPLTVEEPVVVAGVIPRRMESLDAVQEAFLRETGIDPAVVAAIVGAPGVQPDWFLPIVELRGDDYIAARPALYPVPGIAFREKTARLSVTGDLAATLLGSVGPITAEILEELGAPYEASSVVGRSGLERAFEKTLAGTPSATIDRVSSDGSAVEVLERFEGVAPVPVRTTLSVGVQWAVESAVGSSPLPAAMTVVDTPTGAILGAADNVDDGLNQALEAVYPPGSTFKIVTAAAAVTGGADPATTVDCPASILVDGKTFENAPAGGAGQITFRDAFARSCNTAFIDLGLSAGADVLVATARAFGFGIDTALPLRAWSGSVPEPVDRVELAADSIGQGRVTASPLVMAAAAAAVADGAWRSPHLIEGEAGTPRPLPPGVAETLRDLMGAVVTSGTGRSAAVAGHDVHGKTGTAQVGEGESATTVAWFAGFDGDLAFAVAVEGGGAGGSEGAALVRAFLTALDDGPPPIVVSDPCVPAGAAWSTFQGGAARTGCSLATLPVDPSVRWEATVGVQAWLNSAVVTDDLVIVGSGGDVRARPDGDDGVYALELATGRRRWRTPAAADVNSVTLAGDLVIAAGDQGAVWALEVGTGAQRWSYVTNGASSASPVVVGDLVVVGDASGTVTGLSLETGEPMWALETSGATRGGFATDGRLVYAVAETGDVIAITPGGDVLWRSTVEFPAPSGVTVPAKILAPPTLTGDLVIVTYLRSGLYGSPAVIAYDRLLGSVRWEASADPDDERWGNVRASAAVWGESVVIASGSSSGVDLLDSATGVQRGTLVTGAACDYQWASPVVLADGVVVPRMDGSLVALDFDGRIRWQLVLDDRSGRLDGDCADPRGAPIQASIAVAPDGTVIVGTESGKLYAIVSG